MKKTLLLATIALGLFFTNCKKENKADSDTISEPAKDVKVEMFAFNGGDINVNKLEVFSTDSAYLGQGKKFVDAFYIIKHPKGNLIWDTGLPDNLVDNAAFSTPDGVFTLTKKRSMESSLNSIGLTPDSIQYIAFSHSHFDHLGTAPLFTKAKWLVQEPEYDYFIASEEKPDDDVYKQLFHFSDIEKLNGDHDIFGDGTVQIISTPGHTIGHQSLLVNVGKEQPILLSGDLYHFTENRENKRFPIFNYDAEQGGEITLKSMEKFEALAKEKNAKVFIQHQPEDLEAIQEYLKMN